MFEVKGVPILADELDILNELKRQVYEKTGKTILHKMKKSGNNIMICCPNHNNGQEKKPSCGITTIAYPDHPAGTVHCFACGYTDSLDGMIAKCFGYDDVSYGTKWLIDNFAGGESYQRPSLFQGNSREVKKEVMNYISEEELAKYRFYHPYMYKRRLTNEVIEKYDVGYQKDFLVYEDATTGYKKYDEVVTFPVKDINGNCLFVSRRSIKGKTFYLPTNLEKPVYGLYELPKDCRQVIICESVINALTCVVYGRPAVALFGTGNKSQYEVLNKLPVRKYILALDPDEAGEKGCKRLRYNLKGKLIDKLIIPKGKDINNLSYEEFIALPQISLS